MAGVVPFFMTMAEQFGASPAMIGIIYATLPFFSMLSKPLFGSMADKFQQKKSIFLASIVIMAGSFFATYFIPLDTSVSPVSLNTSLVCDNMGLSFPCQWHQQNTSIMTFSRTCNFSCQSSMHSDILTDICNETRLLCPSDNAIYNPTTSQIYQSEFQAEIDILPGYNSTKTTRSSVCQLLSNKSSSDLRVDGLLETKCKNSTFIPCEIHCTNNILYFHQSSLVYSDGSANVFRVTHQVIFLWTCMTLGWIGMGVAVSMGDTIVIGLLTNKGDFGRQRLWGAVSWGLLSVLTGYLVDMWSVGKTYKDFTPGYFLALGCGVLNVLFALYLKVEKSEKPKNLFQNVWGLFRNPQIVIFAISVFLVGCFTGFLWTFLIVYLNDLGASQMLIGLTIFVESFLGEIPFFFFSDWLLQRIGHARSMTLVLAIFGCRFLIYSLISNPWTVLPVELMQGVTYGLFFAALATYPSQMAPSNLQATLQGMLQGLFEGFGK